MVPIKIGELHEQFHRYLIYTKDPTTIWGQPLENAWAGMVLAAHHTKDEALLNEIEEWLGRWIQTTSLTTDREVAAACAYAGLLASLGMHSKSGKVVEGLKAKLSQLETKRTATPPLKFTLFNSPELTYASVNGLILADALDADYKVAFSDVVRSEASKRWSSRNFRFVFYTATAVELGLVDEIKNQIFSHLLSMRFHKTSQPDLIPILWLFSKYHETVSELGKRFGTLLEEKKQAVWDQFEQMRRFYLPPLSEPKEGVVAAYVPSTMELILLDDAFSSLEKTYKTEPNLLFDIVPLHPKIRGDPEIEKLFRGGYYPQAVFEAFKVLEIEVRAKIPKGKIKGKYGQRLMGEVFDESKPILKLTEDVDRQRGFKFLMMGAMQVGKNPGSHKKVEFEEPAEALQYLSLASVLMAALGRAKRTRAKRQHRSPQG